MTEKKEQLTLPSLSLKDKHQIKRINIILSLFQRIDVGPQSALIPLGKMVSVVYHIRSHVSGATKTHGKTQNHIQ